MIYLEFKHKIDKENIMDLHPLMIMILMDMSFYAHEKGQKLTVTAGVSTKKIDEKLKRVSSSHRTRRAIDLRIRNLPKDFLENFVTHFRNKYNHLGAISSSNYQQKLIVWKSDHLHVQLHSKYSLPEVKKLKSTDKSFLKLFNIRSEYITSVD
jgi:hypothetical protein